ncbi:hypothetical protein K3181_04260 [Qipengyuania sp. YG27]|uniref:Uncharacterized protein n=1 Tax=Qipengyuania mesophila TaxID=2867246 RepID=A0ABS7JSL3_9SPHN|nr:hypothetical protein [Qipengyuania mesophila]MBX7500648.1 hypothetical protein [Qipengyuania mesophila]
MDYNLERKLRFNAKTETGLYPWAIREVSEDGKEGRDKIPWTFSHSFVATELSLHERSAVESKFDDGGSWIRAALEPESVRRYGKPKYSMFGTSRPIEDIFLVIRPIADNAEADVGARAASASAWPSRTDTDPMWGQEFSDMIQFDLAVPKAEFDLISQRIAADQIGAARFDCHARGFYAEWTPDIDADEYKVLCSEQRGQDIEMPEDSDIDLPRVGKVWDATFSISKAVKPHSIIERMQKEVVSEDEVYDSDWGGSDLPAPTPDPRWVAPFYKELKDLKMLVGAMIVLLMLILFFA